MQGDREAMRNDVQSAVRDALAGQSEHQAKTLIELSGSGNLVVLGDVHYHDRVVMRGDDADSPPAAMGQGASLHRAK